MTDTSIAFVGPEPTVTVGKLWLVVIKPKIRHSGRLPTFEVVVEATDVHAAKYAAKNAHPQVFNTLDTRYHDPHAREITLNTLFKITP